MVNNFWTDYEGSMASIREVVENTDGLKVELPPEKPCDYAFTLKIAGLG